MLNEAVADRVANLPRWALERMEEERAAFMGEKPNPANVDVFILNPTGWGSYLAFAAYIARAEPPPPEADASGGLDPS